MTIGIYKLNFKDTNKVYIGQSINIEQRYKNHLYSLKRGDACKKLQEAYNIYGIPSLEILLDNIDNIDMPIDISELDSLEEEFIKLYDSFYNGFNSQKDVVLGSIGISNGMSDYSEEKYLEVFSYLQDSSITFNEIVELTNVSKDVITQISNGTRHNWLNARYPVEYKIMRESHNTRDNFVRKDYPIIVSPEGKEYKVISTTDFAKKHNLDTAALSRLFSGKYSHTKGWYIKGNTKPIITKDYPTIISPEGKAYKITHVNNFAKENGLDSGGLSRLLNGQYKTHRGWKIST